MKTLIVVLGPTGVGKTELCLSLAEHLAIPIINADSRQIFAELPIGTAAPTAEQQQRVKHYFVGNHHIEDYYSAAQYEADVMNIRVTVALVSSSPKSISVISMLASSGFWRSCSTSVSFTLLAA